MDITLSDHFTYKKIFKFSISSILMMIFTSLYGIVDGFFISNYAGLDEYAGVNLIMPVIMIIGGIGFMFGTGGSALVGKLLGQKENNKANNLFTNIIIITFIIGIIISVSVFFLIEPITIKMASISPTSTNTMIEKAIEYGRILSLGQVFFMSQCVFQNFLVVAEKPKLGFIFTIAAGLTNMFLDFLLIKVFQLNVLGASIATIMGYIVGTIGPLIYFISNKNLNIHFVKPRFEIKPILKCCYNGLSEFINNISSCIVGFVINIQFLKYFGQNGISAYGTIMYVSFLFFAVFIGYSIAISPIISYNYGANNKNELNSILKKSLIIITICSLIMFILSETLGIEFAKVYVGKDIELLKITTKAFYIFSFGFLFCGFSIFLSAFFTALNNGLISSIISILRTLVLEVALIMILPLIFDGDGIWLSSPFANVLSMIISFILLIIYNKKYHYFINKK